MTQESYKHPIAPPPDLLHNWCQELKINGDRVDLLLIKAAQWGADQELEECCELLRQKGVPAWSLLRLHRRPKPPSLKEQALALIEGCSDPDNDYLDDDALATIRRALEQLDD
jgi:hypothetical protein